MSLCKTDVSDARQKKSLAKALKAFILILAAFASMTVSSPAMAQEDNGGGGFLGGITDYFTIENNAESFDDRRDGAKILLESYPCIACGIFDNFASAVFAAEFVLTAPPVLVPGPDSLSQSFSLLSLAAWGLFGA